MFAEHLLTVGGLDWHLWLFRHAQRFAVCAVLSLMGPHEVPTWNRLPSSGQLLEFVEGEQRRYKSFRKVLIRLL